MNLLFNLSIITCFLILISCSDNIEIESAEEQKIESAEEQIDRLIAKNVVRRETGFRIELSFEDKVGLIDESMTQEESLNYFYNLIKEGIQRNDDLSGMYKSSINEIYAHCDAGSTISDNDCCTGVYGTAEVWSGTNYCGGFSNGIQPCSDTDQGFGSSIYVAGSLKGCVARVNP